MHYRYLDMETYKRKDHFLYFNSLAFPYVGLTANVDITELLQKIKADRLPFFLTICYCVREAANQIPEFRQMRHFPYGGTGGWNVLLLHFG